MMNTDDIACSICGNEYDAATSPELDSTNLCPDCAMMQRRARQPRNLPARQIDQLAMRAQD